jgi:hypothetical protein
LPKMAGYIDPTGLEGSSPEKCAEYWANRYVDVINARVFEKVQVPRITPWIEPGQTEAFAYDYPGNSPGFQWSKYGVPPTPTEPAQLGLCATGAGGLFASVDDLCPVMESLCKNDGRILSQAQWAQMRAYANPVTRDANGQGPYFYPVGMGGTQPQTPIAGPRTPLVSLPVNPENDKFLWLSMNGGASDDNGNRPSEAVVALFGSPNPTLVTVGNYKPVVGTAVDNGPVYGVLLINSNIVPHTLSNWMWCEKCGALWWTDRLADSGSAACPAGGTHSTTNSGVYDLFPTPLDPLWQPDWQVCTNCEALWFTGYSGGNCSAAPQKGGPHEPGVATYSLAMNGVTGPPPGPFQSGWQHCNNCQVLFFPNAANGPCAAGGSHNSHNSPSYVLAEHVTNNPDVVFTVAQAMLDALEP